MRMTDQEYHAHPALSKSKLWKLKQSPAHFKYEQDNPSAPTPAMEFGSALHCAILEPDRYAAEYIIAPECDRRTKEGKAVYAEFLLIYESKKIISVKDFELIQNMAEALNRHSLAKQFLKGEFEKPIFWKDESTGEAMKGKCDCIGDDFIVDIKTCADASTRDFMFSAAKFGYDLQASMYLKGSGMKRFYFIAIEKTPPYAINVLEADSSFISRGNELFNELMKVYSHCKETNNWYGYNKMNEINMLSSLVGGATNGDTCINNRSVGEREVVFSEEF